MSENGTKKFFENRFRCEIRQTHAGSKFVRTKFSEYPSVKRDKWKKGAMVKSRNEPCGIT